MTSSSFELLDRRIQRFLWKAQWEALHAAQEKAIPLLLQSESDLIIAAPTAAGKTEAAILPALTRFLQIKDALPNPHEMGLRSAPEGTRQGEKRRRGELTVPETSLAAATVHNGHFPAPEPLIIYISPLKALINDQYNRLEHLCEDLDIPVHAWHGDISAARKKKFIKKPEGILLITPESVEAMLCRRGTDLSRIFAGALFFIIDELHAFIGSERGKQLQSLLHRIEINQKRHIRRIGLSATLGNMALGAEFLRPEAGHSPAIPPVSIVDAGSGDVKMKILVKGFTAKPALSEKEQNLLEELGRLKLTEEELIERRKELGLSEEEIEKKEEKSKAVYAIAEDLFKKKKI